MVEPVTLKIKEGSDVVVNSLVITGDATDLRIIIDGSLSCGRLSVAKGLKNVLLSGNGQIEVLQLIYGYQLII